MSLEHQKQLSGKWYNPSDIEIKRLQAQSRIFMQNFNIELDSSKRFEIMKNWFKEIGDGSFIEPHFFCDFGVHLILGKNVYINTNCTILDSALVKIGDNTMIGSGVQILTPFHPLAPNDRISKTDNEKAKPISIGKNCWIASGSIILPGITIGNGTTIGAGSVVTKDIQENSLAVGNPCKIIKRV